MNRKASIESWLTKRKVICVTLVLLVAGYIYAQPTLEKWTGLDLPSIGQETSGHEGVATEERKKPKRASEGSPSRSERRDTVAKKEDQGEPARMDAGPKFELKDLGGGRFRSPEGLVYTRSRNEHRIDHVMRHAKDMPNRNQRHGVFTANDRDDVLFVIDQAYRLIKDGASGVTKEVDDDRNVFVVDMGRKIGYVGGRTGKRSNYPPCHHIKLVLAENRVITAYPIQKR